MVNLSTKIFGLAGTALVFAGMAFGQQATCSSGAGGPLVIRAETTNDVVGDLTVTCTLGAGFTATPAGTVNIQVFAPTGVTFTSKILDATNGYSEAVAWTDGVISSTNPNNLQANYTAASAVLGTISASGNSINFIGIPTPALAAGSGTSAGQAFKVLISNIRVNPAGLTVSTTGAPPAFNLTPIVSGGTVFQGSLSSQQVAVVEYALGGASTGKGYGTAPTAGVNNFVVCKSYNPTANAGADLVTLSTVVKVS